MNKCSYQNIWLLNWNWNFSFVHYSLVLWFTSKGVPGLRRMDEESNWTFVPENHKNRIHSHNTAQLFQLVTKAILLSIQKMRGHFFPRTLLFCYNFFAKVISEDIWRSPAKKSWGCKPPKPPKTAISLKKTPKKVVSLWASIY